MIGRLNSDGGGNVENFIKGIYEELKVSNHGNVNAGDFVRVLSDYSQTNEVNDTQLSSSSYTGRVMSAVALSENKVFIAHSISGNDTTDYLHGVVCTISGTAITVGIDTKLSSSSYTGRVMSAVALSQDKVFIAHPVNEGYYLRGVVCTISGTTISVGQNIPISVSGNMAVMYSGQVISAVKLDEGKVFIAHSYGSDYYLYGIVCTINGTTITSGTDTALSRGTCPGKTISVVTLSEGKVFIAHSLGELSYLCGMVCTISGTTIAKGDINALNTTDYTGKVISVVALSENKIFIAHSGDNSNLPLKAIICTISGTTATAGTNTVLNSSTNTGKVISAIAFNQNKVLVVHSGVNNYLYSMLCDINDTTIIKGIDRQLNSNVQSGYAISAITLAENKAFIAHRYGSYNQLYGLIQDYFLNLVKTITSSTEKIGGVAITSGQVGEMITTVRPNVN